ncbi:hypothetical protein B4U79_00113 [Dinothrombium tinctorium]|uniref:Caveolin n=1 Tax=Dinothrombium tinctorium TaxID=1965070 RepID=A0A3S3PKA2_9ACAR|nr:hypothetical protein B4U79_00113 [Dinothrombium tinctorium]
MDSKTQKSGSKTNLNESTLPLLEEHEGKGETPEKEEKIELETKGNAEKDEKTDDEKKDDSDDKKKDKKQKEKKVKKPKEKKEGQSRLTLNCAQNFTIGLNVLDRDEKGINDHVNLTFEDIIAETDSNQSFEFFWRLTFILFNFTRFWIYRILAAIIAIPIALIWAIIFAFVNLITVWCCTPSLGVYNVILYHLHKVGFH